MRKKVGIIICILLVLVFCIHTAARFDYHGLVLEKILGIDCKSPDEYVSFESRLIFQNHFGRTAVYSTKDYKPIDTYAPKLNTHFNMLSLQPGMSVEEVIATAGMPFRNGSGGLTYLDYKTWDGYIYKLRFQSVGREGAKYVTHIILSPEDNYADPIDANAFQWQVRFFYIGLAAVLSIILVCLLVIPKEIQKRKQTA